MVSGANVLPVPVVSGVAVLPVLVVSYSEWCGCPACSCCEL